MDSFIKLSATVVFLWVTTLVSGSEDAVLVGDIDVHTDKNAVADSFLKWPNGIVPYVISDEFDDAIVKKIQAAMKSIEDSVNSGDNSCINFVPHTGQYNHIDIFQGSRCHSSVGMQNTGRQEVSIGPGCEFKGIITHELLHALGFYHEHSRYDRDENVHIDFSNVASADILNFELKTPNELSLQGIAYDFDSIMSYDPYTMAVDTSLPVIVPLPGKSDNVFQMGQRMWLSKKDVLKIQRLYGCPEDTSHIVQPEKDATLLQCNFQSGLCGMTGGGADFEWERTSDPSPNGPAAGHSTGTDTYLVAQASEHSGQTSMLTTPIYDRGGPCIDFFLFLKDSSSSLVIEVSGPQFMATAIPFAPSSWGYGQWTRYQRKIHLPEFFEFQIHFKAVIGKSGTSDVALDDIRIYTGSCN